jgi:hypothetical protein
VDEPLEGVNFPVSLPTFAFGCEFIQPFLGVTLAASLEASMFGGLVNEPLEGGNLPACLLTLAVGCEVRAASGRYFASIPADVDVWRLRQ